VAEQKILSKEELAKIKRPKEHRDVPRGQIKGAFGAGPTELLVCDTCSKLFSSEKGKVVYGIRKRDAARHLEDHRMGRIKRPVEPK